MLSTSEVEVHDDWELHWPISYHGRCRSAYDCVSQLIQ